MSKNASALASLTANYTDSENEDGHESDENNSPPTEDSNEYQVSSENKCYIDSIYRRTLYIGGERCNLHILSVDFIYCILGYISSVIKTINTS